MFLPKFGKESDSTNMLSVMFVDIIYLKITQIRKCYDDTNFAIFCNSLAESELTDYCVLMSMCQCLLQRER